MKLRKPNSIILDVYGVLSAHSFKQTLKQYVVDHIQQYLTAYWSRQRVKGVLKKLIVEQKNLITDNFDLPLLLEEHNEQLDEKAHNLNLECLVKHVIYRTNKSLYSDSLLLLWNDVWEYGYKNGTLKSHVYDEVPAILEEWRMHQYIKLYTLASGHIEGQRMFFENTCKGNLRPFIANHMDSSALGKTNEKSYNAIVYALRDKPTNLLYLTDSLPKLKAAQSVQLNAVLVCRDSTSQEMLGENILKINSLADLEFEDPPKLYSGQFRECC